MKYVGLTIPAKRGENLVNVSSELRVITHLVEFFLHHTNLGMLIFLRSTNEVARRYCFHRCLSFCQGGEMHWDLGTYLLDMGPKHLPLLPLDMGTYPLPCYWHLVVITGEICSDLFTWGSTLPRTQPPSTDIWWWPPKHVRLASRQHTSSWNAASFENQWEIVTKWINSNAIINLSSLHWIII